MFNDTEKAWLWAVEVLRMQRFARISSIYDQVLREEGESEEVGAVKEPVWVGEPLRGDEKVEVAGKVAALVDGLGGRQTEALRLFGWGDYADEARLKRALAFQTRMRSEGVRVRLSYRYSYRQLGLLWGCDHKTAAKWVRDALLALGFALEREGLLWVPEVGKTNEHQHQDISLVA